MLKSWAVRRLAAALSDYVEGVTPESVDTSLGLDTGELDLKGASVNPAAFRQLGLELVNSKLSIGVRIPWRHLDTEPTKVEVRSLWLELRMQPRDASLDGGDSELRRAAKEAEVKRLEDKRTRLRVGTAAAANSATRLARVSHMVLRQIRVAVGTLHARIHREDPEERAMDIHVDSATLDSVGPDWRSPPVDSEEDLRKVLGIVGLAVQIEGAGEPALGPLAFGARLWHSPARAFAQLQIEVRESELEVASLRINAPMIKYFRGCLSWCLHARLDDGSTLPDGSGRAYSTLYTKQLKGEPYDSKQLQEIEDAAPPSWLAGWRVGCRIRLEAARQHTESLPRNTWAAFWGWTKSAGEASGNMDLDALLDEAGAAGLMPTFSLPSEVQLVLLAPRSAVKSFGSDQCLEAVASGAECSIIVSAASASSSDRAARASSQLWRVMARLELASVAFQLDKQPLVEWLNCPQKATEGADVQCQGSCDGSISPPEICPGRNDKCALQLLVSAEQKHSLVVDGKPTWDVSVSLCEEPLCLRLAPWSLQRLFATCTEFAEAWKATGMDKTGQPRPRPVVLPVVDDGAPEAGVAMTVAAGLAEVGATLRLDVSVEAPIIHWETPSGSEALVMHLGAFRARSRSPAACEPGGAQESMELPPEAEAVVLSDFACACELRETRVAVIQRGGLLRSVHDPSTVMLQVHRNPEGEIVMSAEIDQFRCHIGPELMKVVGQLRLGLDYACTAFTAPGASLAAKTGAEAAASGKQIEDEASTEQATLNATESDGRRAHAALLRAHVTVKCAEVIMCGGGTLPNITAGGGCGKLELVHRGAGVTTASALVSSLSIKCGQRLLLSSEGSLSADVNRTPSELAVKVQAAPVSVLWVAEQIRQLLAACRGPGEWMREGEAFAGRMLPVSENEGMSRRLWNRFVTERAQQMRGEVWWQACQYGLGALDRDVGIDGGGARAQDLPTRSFDIQVNCAELSFALELSAPVEGAQALRAVALNAECQLRKGLDGTVQAETALSSLELSLGPQVILAPRRADVQLLHLTVHAEPPPTRCTSVELAWAQVALVYRQRDIDTLAGLVRSDVVDALKPQEPGPPDDAVHASAPAQTLEAAAQGEHAGSTCQPAPATAPGLRYTLSVGAPLVFFPTCTQKVQENLGRGLCVDKSGSEGYAPAAGEGFGVVDFGHIDARSEQSGHWVLHLQQVQAFSAPPQDANNVVVEPSAWGIILRPLSVSVEVTKLSTHYDISVTSPLEGSKDHQHLSLNRFQATQWIDIAFLNFNYRSADQLIARECAESSAPLRCSAHVSSLQEVAQAAATAVANSSFHFMLAWQGPLCIDASFTDDAPLACLQLVDGSLEFESRESGQWVEIQCRSGGVTDMRAGVKSSNKMLIDCAAAHSDTASLVVRGCLSRSASEIDRFSVDLQQPVLWVLPQLWMDLATWGLSVYQQSAQAGVATSAPGSGQESDAPSAVAAQDIEIRIKSAACRVPVQWETRDEYFEVAGDVSVSLFARGGAMRIRQIALSGGRLLRGAPAGSPGLLCTRFECEASGASERTLERPGGERANVVTIDRLAVKPFWIRLSVLDHASLAAAITALVQMEASSAEPAEEIRQRDPLALVVRQQFIFAASIELEGMELQLLDDSGGGDARPVLELKVHCPLLLLNMETSRGQAPKGSVKSEHISICLRSYNERVCQWEPVLSTSPWFANCNVEPCERQGEVIAKVSVAPCQPVQIVVTVPFVHTMSRLLPDLSKGRSTRRRRQTKYGDMLLGLNLTGTDCIMSCTGGQKQLPVGTSGVPVSLDELIVGAESSGSSCLPELQLQLTGLPGRPCMEVPLTGESSIIWPTDIGPVAVHVLMPRPPQRLVMLASTVSIKNETPLDLELRFHRAHMPLLEFLDGHCNRDTPMELTNLMTPATPAVVLEGSGAEVEEQQQSEVDKIAILTGHGGHTLGGKASTDLYLPAGYVLAAPMEAVPGVGISRFQIRPSPTSTGVEYTFGALFDVNSTANGLTSASQPLGDMLDLPAYHIHLVTQLAASGCSTVVIEPPFRIANACPFPIHCAMGGYGWEPRRLGDETDRCDASAKLKVFDGYSGEWDVPPEGWAQICPLKLDSDGWFYWSDGTGQKRSRPRWRQTDFLQVERKGSRIVWHCCQGVGGIEKERSPLLLAPQKELPVFDVPVEGMFFSVALREQRSNDLTTWSRPLPAVAPPRAAVDLPLQLNWKGLPVPLKARRADGRRIVVFAQQWFANATGLDVRLLLRRQSTELPSFGSDIYLPVEHTESEDAGVRLHLGGQTATDTLIPGLGESAKVALSPLHQCILTTEPISMSATFGVLTELVSLVPATMVFSHVDGCEVGFRQTGCTEVLWIGPGSSAALYWSRKDCPRKLEVAVRPSTRAAPATHDVFSSPFEVAERGIGAFPIVLMESPSVRRLLCIHADQCGQLFTITAKGEDHCHQLVNQHPCLVLDACFEGEEFIDSQSHFVVPYGQRVAIGRSARSWQLQSRLMLILGDTKQSAHAKRLYVDLGRGNRYNVLPAEEFPVHAAIRVELLNRVAVVTVAPLLLCGPVTELSWGMQLDVQIPFITLSAVGEQPRAEVIACTLTGTSLVVKQSSAGQRESVCELVGVQVDVYQPRPEVVFASIGQRALRLHVVREDIARGDTVIRNASVEMGYMELHVFEELVGLMKKLGQAMKPRPLGLELDVALSRAGVPFNLTCGAHPASQKYVFHDIHVSAMKVGVWCQISLALLPDLVSLVMKLSSFSPMLEVDGARMKLPEQRFFGSGSGGPFEGSLEALGSALWRRYKPCLQDSWRSVVNNSNAVLGGLFGRHAWAPRRRQVDVPRRPLLRVRDGAVRGPDAGGPREGGAAGGGARSFEPMPRRGSAGPASGSSGAGAGASSRGASGAGATAHLDEEGYRCVVATQSAAEMRTFILRVVSMIGCVVNDERGLSGLASRHNREIGTETFVHLIEELSDPKTDWVQPAGESGFS